MNKRLVGGLTGYPGTGKSTLAAYMSENYGFRVLEGSAIIRDLAAEVGERLATRESYDQFFRDRQRAHGMSWLSDITLAARENKVLQSGLRSKYDFRNLKNRGGFIVALVCPTDVAVARIDATNPKNPTTPQEYEQHVQLEESPDEFGMHMSWCITNADYQLNTAKPLEETYAEVDELVHHLTH